MSGLRVGIIISGRVSLPAEVEMRVVREGREICWAPGKPNLPNFRKAYRDPPCDPKCPPLGAFSKLLGLVSSGQTPVPCTVTAYSLHCSSFFVTYWTLKCERVVQPQQELHSRL